MGSEYSRGRTRIILSTVINATIRVTASRIGLTPFRFSSELDSHSTRRPAPVLSLPLESRVVLYLKDVPVRFYLIAHVRDSAEATEDPSTDRLDVVTLESSVEPIVYVLKVDPSVDDVRAVGSLLDGRLLNHEIELVESLECHPEWCKRLGLERVPDQSTLWRSWHERFTVELRETVETAAHTILINAQNTGVDVPCGPDRKLAGAADVVEVIVEESAPIAGKTLKQANENGLLSPGILVVQIDRGDETITPSGRTVVEEDDFVTTHSRSGITDETLGVFTGE